MKRGAEQLGSPTSVMILAVAEAVSFKKGRTISSAGLSIQRELGFWDREEEAFSFFSPGNNFPLPNIASITCDSSGNFWAVSGGDASAVYFQHPETATYFELAKGSGRYSRVSTYGHNNMIYFYSMDGLDEINPDDFQSGRGVERRSIQLIDLYVEGRRMIPGSRFLSTTIKECQELTLPAKIGSFAISFSDLLYSEPRRDYEFRLKPLIPNWSATNTNQATFFNVPPGTYEFEVKTKQSEVKRLSINVLPPWYQTWWARSFLAVLAAFITFSIINNERKKAIQKESEKL